MIDTQKNTILPKETATVEWVLYSQHFDDITLKAPEGLNDLPHHPTIPGNSDETDQEAIF